MYFSQIYFHFSLIKYPWQYGENNPNKNKQEKKILCYNLLATTHYTYLWCCSWWVVLTNSMPCFPGTVARQITPNLFCHTVAMFVLPLFHSPACVEAPSTEICCQQGRQGRANTRSMYKENPGLYSLSGKTSYRQILWSLEAVRCFNDHIALKFDRHLGSPTADVPVKF